MTTGRRNITAFVNKWDILGVIVGGMDTARKKLCSSHGVLLFIKNGQKGTVINPQQDHDSMGPTDEIMKY